MPRPPSCYFAFILLLGLTAEILFMQRPLSFYLASILLVGMAAEILSRRRGEPWFLPALMVLVTTLGWYFVDPFMNPRDYESLPESIVSISYWQVCLFLVAFRALLPMMAQWLVNARAERRAATLAAGSAFTPARFFYLLAGLWAVLMAFGIMQMGGDVFGAFFPLDSRAGNYLWARGSAGDAGPFAFLVSTAGYCHALVCALLGVSLFYQRNVFLKLANAGLIALAWPHFLLMGARNAFLAVLLPLCLCYLMFGRQPLSMRLVAMVILTLSLNFVFRVVVNYRNEGFRALVSDASERKEMMESDLEQHGLNMIQELCFINIFSQVGQLKPDWGGRYLADLAGVVPRALWPNKPLPGIDYAIWRGFGGGDSDIGVVATISMGFIGGGIMNFGPLFGPLAPAAFMALWCGVLARWWTQRASILRLCLFLAGLGLTFNLGRDLTLLVLWPIIFGYFGMRLLEWFFAREGVRSRVPVPGAPRGRLVPVPMRPWGAVTDAAFAPAAGSRVSFSAGPAVVMPAGRQP